MNTQANAEQLTRLFLFAAWAVNNGWSTETVFSFVELLTNRWNENVFATYEAAMTSQNS